jgi:two-component system, LytTR family, sensor kinase
MTAGIPTGKLFRTALYSSLILIGTLAIAPHAIIFNSFSVAGFFQSLIFLIIFIVFIWGLNIGLVCLAETKGPAKWPMYKRYLLSYFICLSTVFITKFSLKLYVLDPEREPAHLYAIFVLSFILNTIVIVMQDLVLAREKKSKIELENAELKVKHVEATNQQLKQQIHPHFLFNSLNTLKSLIHKDPVQAEDYLIKLSDFLRASLLSSTPNSVGLKEELKLCKDYLQMQQMRFGKALVFTIAIPAEIQVLKFVPVFSILPALENAIKHNVLTIESPLFIRLDYTDGRIVITNNLQPRVASQSTGLGLKNLAERYKILSGDEIIVHNDGKIFSVSIKALDNEGSDHRG